MTLPGHSGAMGITHLRRYRIQAPDGSWRGPYQRADVMNRVDGRVPKHETYHIERRGTGVTGAPILRRSRAIDDYADALAEGKVGEVFRLAWGDADQEMVLVRTVQIEVRTLETPGNAHVDAFASEVFTRWPGAENWGTLSHRYIGTTRTPSQHCAFKPLRATEARRYGFALAGASAGANAIDLHDDAPKRMGATFTLAIAEADRFGIAHAIYNLRQWTPEDGLRPYDPPPGGSAHKDHGHYAFRRFRREDELAYPIGR